MRNREKNGENINLLREGNGMKRTVMFLSSLMLALTLILSACGSQGGDRPQATDGGDGKKDASESKVTLGSDGKPVGDNFTTEPITVTLLSHYAAINTPNDVDALFGKVREIYPNITIELIKGITLNQMIASGEVPDIIATQHYHMMKLLPLGVASDLTDTLVNRFNLDLNRFEPEVIEAIRSFSKDGELLSLPYTLNYGVLIYNKDLFDKFAVPYPKDGATWEELLELSKRLTREDNGVQYIGLDPGSVRNVSRGYSLPTAIDDKPVLESEGYKKVFAMLKSFYEIPGFIDSKGKYSYGIDYFMKDQKMAMFPTWLAAITSRLPQLDEPGRGFNWDIAAHPVFSDRPEFGREIEFQSFMVPPTSKNKEAAYRVILAMLSDESQEWMNRGNNLTSLNRPDLREQFASNTDLYKDKNLKGLFKVKPAPAPQPSEYDVELYSYIGEALKQVIISGEDINTALRTANEKGEKYIQMVKSQ